MGNLVKMFSNIYSGKKVFVTGDSGFKGSWLVLWLQELGAEVIGYSLEKPSVPNHADLLDLTYTKIRGDIRDLEQIKDALSAHNPDIVFHLAAQPLVRKSYTDPVSTFNTNIMGTVNLLEAIRSCSSVKAVVVVTSDKCYENNEDGKPFVETDPLGGFDPYSASKGATEIVASSYYNSFLKDRGTLLATVRAGNVIGGGDWGEDRLVPDIIKATSQNKTVEIRSPNAVRPWQHVLEPLSGYLLVGQKLLEGDICTSQPFNFGPENSGHITVRAVGDIAKQKWESISIAMSTDTDLHEAQLLSLDCSQAKEILNWRPLWGAEKAIEMSVQWYLEFYENDRIVTNEQLNQFIQNAKESNQPWVN